MKIDSHQHFWIYNPSEYGWIDDRMQVLKRDYLPETLYKELIGAGYEGTIAVQARQSVEETRWLLELASRYDYIRGVVGWVNLCDENRLKRELDEFCTHNKLVGVRHVVHDEPDDEFMLRDDFLRGINLLKDYGLTYDLLLFPGHLAVAQKLVSMFPEQRFVLDHISKPLIKNKLISPWNENISLLAGNRNVGCKLSGMVTEADRDNNDPEIFRPYLDVVFEAFGPGRLMIGSDWPVCRVSADYADVMAIVEDYISDLPDTDKKKITGSNCACYYGIKE
ncbi:MAG TPA: amidohydrolase family protein [Bacteroidales bacterium]|nr:amidohydrolase family protein [Bacteroidales bacterium]HPJ58760.1 amidohydrolase family protein [Bacteroidales bacterium]HPR11910.1 amidohydrolase family protein [Bacteroidales bacterium]